MVDQEKISQVFRSTGQPSITYVNRDSGLYERRLNGYLDEAGQLCLITGPSKTGKTTLYKRVLAERNQTPLVVQCTKDKTSADLWREALEQINFERTTEVTDSQGNRSQIDIGAEGEGGLSWLAKLSAKLGISQETSINSGELKQRVLAEPSADHLIPILHEARYVLVIEDFHYLSDNEKKLIFQQWKRFIDNEITILVLGTSHRAVDIASSNKDLLGRIGQIDVSQWQAGDLKKICEQGFAHLKAQLPPAVLELIATESVGLPIVTQQICLELFNARSIFTTKDARRRSISFAKSDAQNAFFEVARNRYTQFESYYQSLVRGPREKARVYKTYELVIACFTIDPIQFDLARAEIDRRLEKVCAKLTDSRPPPASVNSTLGALHSFQSKRGFDLLEWRPTEDKLYIVEPSFLFYVRWRTQKSDPEQLDFFELLIKVTDLSGDLSGMLPQLAKWRSSGPPGMRSKDD